MQCFYAVRNVYQNKNIIESYLSTQKHKVDEIEDSFGKVHSAEMENYSLQNSQFNFQNFSFSTFKLFHVLLYIKVDIRVGLTFSDIVVQVSGSEKEHY